MKKAAKHKCLTAFRLQTSGVRDRTGDLRAMNPDLAFLSVCEQMVYTYQIKTYDARRSAAEAQASARRTSQLRIWLRAGHIWLRA